MENGNNPLISVIVPVYNVEPYLRRCIDSILAQTYENLEIILVDDGSPDRCGEICDEYARLDRRIRVIHQENSGVSAARNAALAVAEGEYIGFVDSDDWIEPNMYEEMYEAILATDSDIAVIDFVKEPCPEVAHQNDSGKREVLSGVQAYCEMMKGEKFQGHMCSKLARKAVLKKNTFCLDISVLEDMLFCTEMFFRTRKVVYQKSSLYHYWMSDQSLSHSMDEHTWSMLHALEMIVELTEVMQPEVINTAKQKCVWAYNGMAGKLVRARQLNRENYGRLRSWVEDHISEEARKSAPLTKKVSVFIFLHSRVLFILWRRTADVVLSLRRKLTRTHG